MSLPNVINHTFYPEIIRRMMSMRSNNEVCREYVAAQAAGEKKTIEAVFGKPDRVAKTRNGRASSIPERGFWYNYGLPYCVGGLIGVLIGALSGNSLVDAYQNRVQDAIKVVLGENPEGATPTLRPAPEWAPFTPRTGYTATLSTARGETTVTGMKRPPLGLKRTLPQRHFPRSSQ